MFKSFIFGILLFLFSIPATTMGWASNADTSFVPNYRWPIDGSRHLSGTFGETRSTHFHSGIDIKTWGREGYPVLASEKGYISPDGYKCARLW